MRRKKFTDEWKKKFCEAVENGTIRTDSGVEDFCTENNLSQGDVFGFLHEQNLPQDCKGCKRSCNYPNGYCLSCCRGKQDYYLY